MSPEPEIYISAQKHLPCPLEDPPEEKRVLEFSLNPMHLGLVTREKVDDPSARVIIGSAFIPSSESTSIHCEDCPANGCVIRMTGDLPYDYESTLRSFTSAHLEPLQDEITVEDRILRTARGVLYQLVEECEAV